MIEPDRGALDSSAVLLIHGTRTSFEQALAWSFDQGQAANSSSPIIGLALTLAAHGLRVLIPFVDDERLYGYHVPWSDLSRYGNSLAVRGLGNGQSILLGNLLGGLDFLASRGLRHVAVIGDKEGGGLALALGALDARVEAIGSLMPPLDRPALRQDIGEFLRWPLYTQVECAVDDPMLASVLTPKALLFAWDATDSELTPLISKFRSRSVDGELRRLYQDAGALARLRIQEFPNRSRTQVEVSRWALDALSHGKNDAAIILDIQSPPPTSRDRYPASQIATLRAITADAVSNAAPFAQLNVNPDFGEELSFAESVRGAREESWRILTGTLRLPEPAAKVVRRDTLRVDGDYVLERVVLQWLRGGIRFEALLATPSGATGKIPLVFSLDVTSSSNELFGLPPIGRTAYLGAYGDVLARSGYAVFAPIIEGEVPNLLSPMFRARDPEAAGAWSYLLPLYRAALGSAMQLVPVDSQRVIAYGISFAGYAALATAAFDDRVTELVYSNPAHVHSMFFASGVGDPAPWLTDGAAVWDVIERYLIFPKRFIREVESAERYERFEFQRVRELQDLYVGFGRGDRFRFVYQPGGHQTVIAGILPWLNSP
jgi:hypothetical protein